MRIGIPKEVKSYEKRVGATPEMVHALVEAGHIVLVQEEAGLGSGFPDATYKSAGAVIVADAADIWGCEMVVKVKEPESSEYEYLREGLILFCYLHLAANAHLTQKLVEKKVVAIAFETVTEGRRLPLLVPMSQIAGRLSIQVGAMALQVPQGGKGILLGGVSGVPPAKVAILGGGVVGTEAARMAMGCGADVTILDRDLKRLEELDMLFGPYLKTLFSTTMAIEQVVMESDLVIGAVLIPGGKAPSLVTKEMVKNMSPGSAIVDVAIDQGGCVETSQVTTHGEPTFIIDGVVHYCVANMPGACARTGTLALGHATLHYVLRVANKGFRVALNEDQGFRNGLNTCNGHVTNEYVAFDLGYEFYPSTQVL